MRKAEAAQEAALQGERLRLEQLPFHAALEIGSGAKIQNGGNQLVEKCTLGGGDLRRLAQRLPQARVVVALECG